MQICPEIGGCTSLEEVRLCTNRLITLPHTIGGCCRIKEVSLFILPLLKLCMHVVLFRGFNFLSYALIIYLKCLSLFHVC